MTSDEYLDTYLPVIAFDVAIEEKLRIAKMAAATLHKLHNVMQQMKDWRDDSAKLKSNIWRMKMALRAEDENGNDNQQTDPLIVHQKAEISRLEQANDALENEVTSLRRALAKTEEDIARISEIGNKIIRIEDGFLSEERSHDEILRVSKKQPRETENGLEMSVSQLKYKLREFAMGDRTIEAVFANAIGKIVETVVGLSEELVNVNENLYRFKARNRNLHRRLDRLKAMLRSRCGSSASYRKRIGELNNLARQLMSEMGRLRVIRETDESFDATDIPDVVGHVERLMNSLRDNLRSDREAIVAAGDPDCLRYMKRVIDLRVNLKVLFVELRRSNAPADDERSTRDNARRDKSLETVSLLNDFLKELDTEIGKLKVTPMGEYCRIGGVSGSRYMTKIAELEEIARKSVAALAVVKRSPLATTGSAREPAMAELEDLIERMCLKMRDLELFDDRATLRERIDRLETSVARLKLKLAEKEERERALSRECESARSTLDRERTEHERIVAAMREERDRLREDVTKRDREISALSREREHSERRAAEAQLMRAEIDAMRQELQSLRDDKEALSREAEEMRNALRERAREIENIISQREALARNLGVELEELRTKLGIASDENVKLKGIIEALGERRPDELESSGERENGRDNGGRYSRDRPRNQQALESGRSETKESTGLEIIGHSRRVPDTGDATRPDLVDEFNERSLGVVSRELERAISPNKGSEVKQRTPLRGEEGGQFETGLPELSPGEGPKSMADADDDEYTAQRDQVVKFTSDEREERRERRTSGREAAAGDLAGELERTRAELGDAAAEVARLRAENSRIAGELDALSARRAETEDRVRVLLAEKNELATRINELDDESVALQERLNKTRAENEYLSMELNKSRVENDEAGTRNALPRAACDGSERDIGESSWEGEDASDDQPEIQRAEGASHGEGNARRGNRLKTSDTRDHPEEDARGLADPRNEITRERDCSDAARASAKVEIGERRDGETELKVESDTCAERDNKAKIKDTPKGELKSPGAENKALKPERANLRFENSGITMELARTKDGFEDSPPIWTNRPNDEEIIGPPLTKFQIVNVGYEGKEMSDYSDDYSKTHEDKRECSTVAGIDQLVTENRTLKLKVHVLRDSLDSSRTDSEKTKTDLGIATDEIRALRHELMNLRDEKTALKSRFEMFLEEFNELKSERTALRDELAALRKSNFDLRLKGNDLRCANERLKDANAGLQSRLQDALTNENVAVLDERLKYNVESSTLNSGLKYKLAKRNLRALNKRLNRNECVLLKSLGPQSVEENLHIEGQK